MANAPDSSARPPRRSPVRRNRCDRASVLDAERSPAYLRPVLITYGDAPQAPPALTEDRPRFGGGLATLRIVALWVCLGGCGAVAGQTEGTSGPLAGRVAGVRCAQGGVPDQAGGLHV